MNAFVVVVIRGSLFNDFVYDEKISEPYCSNQFTVALQMIFSWPD